MAAEATVAESTRSIQFNPAKSNRARWANAAVGPVSLYLSSPSPFVAVLSAAPRFVHEFDGNLREDHLRIAEFPTDNPTPRPTISKCDSHVSSFRAFSPKTNLPTICQLFGQARADAIRRSEPSRWADALPKSIREQAKVGRAVPDYSASRTTPSI